MRRLTVAVALAILPGPLAHAQSMSEAAKARVRSEVQMAVDALAASSRGADVDGMFTHFSKSPGFRIADGEAVYDDFETARSTYEHVFARIRSQDVFVLAPELAVYTGKGSFTSSYKTGETTPRRAFTWTFLWRRESGRWKIVRAHQSLGASSEAAATAAAAANPITGPRYLYIEEFEIPTGTAPTDAIAESASWVSDLRKTEEYRDVRLYIHNTGPAFSLYIMMEPKSWQALETGANKFLAARPDILGKPLKWARHSDNLLSEVPVP